MTISLTAGFWGVLHLVVSRKLSLEGKNSELELMLHLGSDYIRNAGYEHVKDTHCIVIAKHIAA